jgi:hypothetical protein
MLLVALSAGTSSACADLVFLTASRDATIYEAFDGSLANGAGRYLFAGKNNQNRARRGLIHFDIAGALPADAIITSARLTMNLSQGAGAASTVSLHRALASWTTGSSNPDDPEGSGTLAGAGDATWLFSSADGAGGGTAWTTAGGDFIATASASRLTSTVGLYNWSSEQLAADAQAFLTAPEANFGWFILGDESAIGNARRFDSADSATLGGIAPLLVIEFTTVPAPGAIAILGLALRAPRRRTR